MLSRHRLVERILTACIGGDVPVIDAAYDVAGVIVVQREAEIAAMWKLTLEDNHLILVVFEVVGIFPVVDIEVGIGSQLFAVTFQRLAPLLLGDRSRYRVDVAVIIGTGHGQSSEYEPCCDCRK